MSIAYIAGQLKSKGHSVRSFDCGNAFFDSLSEEKRQLLSQMYLTADWYENFERLRKELNLDHHLEIWTEEILRFNPRLVGMSIYRSTLSVSLLLAQAIKSRAPQTAIVFGGPTCADPGLIRHGSIDFLVHGEGETTISDLAERLDTGRSVDDCLGISFLRHGEVVTTAPRPLITDLNQIPFPDFEDFNVMRYSHRVLPMFTSRGCCNRCSFCGEAPQWGKYRYRTAENIVAELQEHVTRYQPHYLKMVDSLINGSLQEFGTMCDLIIAQGINVQWGGMARINPRMNRDFLAKAYRAGCRHLQFGIESCSQKVLDHMRKHIKVADIEQVVRDCHAVGINAACFFMIGYVNETEEDFQASLAFIKRNRPFIADVFPGTGLHIVPGSLLHKNTDEYGLVLPEPGLPGDGWHTRDGSNTFAVRAERLARFNRLVDELFRHTKSPEATSAPNKQQAVDLSNEESMPSARRKACIALFDELEASQLVHGDQSQIAVWQVTMEQEQSRALFLHPPAKLKFTLQSSGRGHLLFAVAIHPEAWGKPDSGACRFLVTADGKLIWERTLNPTRIVEERCWHEHDLDIPCSPNGAHEIVFETQAIGNGTTYRWALWRAPQFFSEPLPLNTASAQIMNTPEPKGSFNQSADRTNTGFSTDSPAGASGSPPKTANDWEILIQHAALAYQRGDALEARKGLASAGTENPGSCEQNLELGYLRLNLGDFSEAAVWFSHAVRLSPELAHTHSSRALAFALANQPTQAREDAERALALNPRDIVALKVLTRVCLNLKRPAQARTLCETILKLHPGDPDAQTMLDQSTVTMPVVEADTLSVKLPAADSSAPVFKISKHLQSLEGLLGDYQTRCEAWQGLGVEHLLQQLVVGDFKQAVEIFPAFVPLPAGSDGLPVPPAALTMGYGAGNMDHYLACGRRSYESLTRLLCKHQVELSSGDVLLDWGGAAGRVVRNFVAESRRGCQVWGCDVHAPSIQWAQNHLSPPFKFFNSSALPHLPFPDRTFKFIYGLSVVTHMITLRDLWLLELQRVLRPDGCLILTVHNESTWQWFRDHQMPPWMPADLKELPEMPGERVEIRGSRWEYCYTFFHSDYLRRIWGQYFEIKDIVPCAEGYQTAVVMKPRAS